MSAAANQAVIRRWWEGINQGNADAIIEEVYAADYVLHDPSQPEPVVGTQGVHEFIASVSGAFPDLHVTIDDLVTEGDRVVQRLTARGTHQGEFLGVPASGNAVEIWLMVVSRMAGGKVAEEWQLIDALTLLQQIGAMPVAA